MQDILGLISQLRRPRLLIRAARFGVEDYARSRHLGRILRAHRLPRFGEALVRLMDIEGEMNDRRLSEDATYSIARHVEVLIAIMGEARLMRTVCNSSE
jgi:hypothetical protein